MTHHPLVVKGKFGKTSKKSQNIMKLIAANHWEEQTRSYPFEFRNFWEPLCIILESLWHILKFITPKAVFFKLLE